jgi:hypothetical protein
MSNNSDAVIAAARSLIAETLQKQTVQRALREGGVTMRGEVASAAIVCTPDPALIEKTRLVVHGDVATVETFDGRDFVEVWRSARPDASPSPAPEPIPEQSSRFGPPVPGQLILTPDGWAWAK